MNNDLRILGHGDLGPIACVAAFPSGSQIDLVLFLNWRGSRIVLNQISEFCNVIHGIIE